MKLLLLITAVCVALSSCQRTMSPNSVDAIDFPIDNITDASGANSRFVLCILNNSTRQELFYMNNMGNTKIFIHGATAELFAVINEVCTSVGVFTEIEDRMILDYNPIPGVQYRLIVSHEGKELSAETTMPTAIRREFVPNPVVCAFDIIYPNETPDLLGIYPSYTIVQEEKKLPIWAFFKKDGEIVNQLYTTNPNIYTVNSINESKTVNYQVVDGVLGGSYKTHNEKAVFPYHSYWIRMDVNKKYMYPYYYCTYTPELPTYSSFYPVVAIMVQNIVANNPSCLSEIRDKFIYGAAFDIRPAYGEKADELYMMVPSKELDNFLGYGMKKGVFRIDNFSHYLEIPSYYSNINGAAGVFGAANLTIEDYRDIDTRTLEQYKAVNLKH